MKTALITGVTGQDGSYLARLLLEKGYKVFGVKRRSSSLNTQRIDDLYQDIHVADARFAVAIIQQNSKILIACIKFTDCSPRERNRSIKRLFRYFCCFSSTFMKPGAHYDPI